jgi:HemY protein
MRLVLLVLGILLIAILTTLLAIEDPGYVLIARMPWSVEMPLTVFAPLLVLGYLLFNGLLYVLVRLWRMPRDVARWRARRNLRRSRTGLVKGLTHLAEGNWVEAESELLAGMRYSDAPLISCLGAALAAQGQGHIDKRDEYLAQAQELAPQQGLAVGMMQAFLQHVARQPEQSLATLTDLHSRLPRHKHLLKLLAQVYLDLRDWTSLVDLLPELRANQAMTPAEIDAVEFQTHRELLTLPLPPDSSELLKRAWNAVPKPLRRHPVLIAVYARQLIRQNEMGEAEALLRRTIDTEWDDALVELYGTVRTKSLAELLDADEGWLLAHPDNPKLLLAAARHAAATGQKGKARDYLEKCINLGGPADAYRDLGEMLERAGEKDQALALYRRGLESLASAIRPARSKSGRSRAIR